MIGTLWDRRCARCQQVKSVTEFYKKNAYCKECTKQQQRQRWATIDGPRQRGNPEAARKRRIAHLKCKYGISSEDYDRLLESQGGLCAVCGTPEAGMGRQNNRLTVDHDHVTGKVRGLLCHECNTGLGKFQEDIDLLERAIAYLKQASEGKRQTSLPQAMSLTNGRSRHGAVTVS